jgi:hypothetical protein
MSTIANVLNDLVRCWVAYNADRQLEDHSATVKAINSGDCGLVAIAASQVLREKFNYNVAILVNRNHCWMRIDGVDYDTQYPEGYPEGTSANQEWSRGDLDPIHELEYRSACEEWMPVDSHGAFLVKAFVERYGLKLPEELHHCIAKVAEYECEAAIPVLQARYRAVKELPAFEGAL